ncbi:MAG: hypothetical protein P8Y45_03205 [Exilibacterium sp.]
MKKAVISAVLMMFVSFLLGCSSNLMVKSNTNTIVTPPADFAKIVFMRSTFVSSAIGVELFEITDGELKFVGSLPNGSKIAHITEPGEKVYMAYGNAADFMLAKVEGGKTYYSIVRPNWGTGGFAPTPIRKNEASDYNMQSDDFNKWVEGTSLLEKKSEAEQWFEKNKGKYEEIYERYWARFQNKSADEKQKRTLMLTDGV